VCALHQATSHFLLFLLSIRSLCVGVTEGRLETTPFQQLNLGMAASAFLALLITISKFILQGLCVCVCERERDRERECVCRGVICVA